MTPLTKQNARKHARVQYRYHRPSRVVTGTISYIIGKHVRVLFDDNSTALRQIDSFFYIERKRGI